MPEPNQTIKLFNRLCLNCLSSSSKHLEETTDDNMMHLRSQTAFRNDELYHAINLGDADKCKELLAMGVINLQHGDYASYPSQEAVRFTLPLQYAVMHREPEIIKVLLRHGADPDCVDIEGKRLSIPWCCTGHGVSQEMTPSSRMRLQLTRGISERWIFYAERAYGDYALSVGAQTPATTVSSHRFTTHPGMIFRQRPVCYWIMALTAMLVTLIARRLSCWQQPWDMTV